MILKKLPFWDGHSCFFDEAVQMEDEKCRAGRCEGDIKPAWRFLPEI